MLSQIPNVSISLAKNLMEKYKSIFNLKNELEENENCLDEVIIVNKNNEERKLNKTVKNNIIKYILKRKETIIKINT